MAQNSSSQLEFPYSLKRSGLLDGIKITIKPQTAEVVVTAGKLIPLLQIESFLTQKQTWIIKSRTKVLNQQKNLPHQVDIFGQTYQKTFGYFPDKKVGVSIIENQIIINSPQLKNADQQLIQSVGEKKLADFLKLTAEKYLRQKTPLLAKQMNLENKFRRISIKKQSTRWGSCSSDKNLNFNWTLVHYPPHIIDYVIIHELAHLVHLNHSQNFWQLVAQFDPDYKKHRRALNS